ncbi:DUF4387 domain-containing protein [Aeromicrobium sp. YIM 150415]|uniref:DUF4387 domain-containing protein n=1 Tax=Aeromicrobium sp. YIM 150415 TaxID=2803912 RepID=UPI001964B026|nr:DUF4387 domain-containing protein [Aeromicrobium sp. YIM 150415]MBM9461966.1 DUF4387 domain-containing protein [Aeromicrobium sp. YIM 150415]
MTTADAPLIADFAYEVRSKNAGPFWTTLETFMRDASGYAIVSDPDFINESVIAELYGVDRDAVQIFRIPELNVVKISFPRRVPQGGLGDRDLHCGQQHVPLATLPVPERLLPSGV